MLARQNGPGTMSAACAWWWGGSLGVSPASVTRHRLCGVLADRISSRKKNGRQGFILAAARPWVVLKSVQLNF